MPSTPEYLTDYLESVAGEIRWPRARRLLLGELRDHIDDQRRDFESMGLICEDAMSRAVAEMGDPVEVGRDLDRLHRPHNAWGAVIVCLLLAGLGVFTFGSGAAYDLYYNASRQLVGILAGALLMLGLWFADYTLLLRRTLLCGAVFCLFFIICGPIYASTSVAGMRMRLLIYPFLLTPILFAALLCKLKGRKHVTVVLCGLLTMVLSMAPLALPFVTASLYMALAMMVLLVYAVLNGLFSVSKVSGLACACAPALLPAVVIFRHPYFTQRLQYALYPEMDPLGHGFLALTVREAWQSIPFTTVSAGALEPPGLSSLYGTDFFFLQLAARFGRFVLPAAVLLTVVLAILALRRLGRLHSRQGRLIGLSALAVLVVEALGYLIYNCGFIFTSPIAFPFLSYGVGSLLLNFCLLGLILSVIRMDSLVRDKPSKWSALTLPFSFTVRLPFHRGKLHIGYEKI